MMKNNKIIVLLLLGVFVASCNDEFLDLKPLESISSENIFKDPALAALYLNEVYQGIPDGFNRGWYMLGAASDDGENAYGWAASNSRFNTSSITPANSPFNGAWGNSYSQIRRVNEFILNYSDLVGNDGEVNRLKGEVHFLRAFYYAELLKHFGGVPIIKVPQSLEGDDLLVARNTRAETTDFIVEDLNAAIGFFATATSAGSSRGSLMSSYALKGRVLLYEGRNTESAVASRKALDIKSALDANYGNIFLNDGTDEVIFDKQFQDPDKTHYGNVFNIPKSTRIPSGWGGTNPTQNLVDEYEMKATGKMITDVTSGYDAANPYTGRDPRFYASILYDGAAAYGVTIETRPGGGEHIDTGGDWTKTGYNLKKLIQQDPARVWGGTQHWVFMRVAEVHLNYAEALIEAGTSLDLAKGAIDVVRQRSQMPAIALGDQAEMRTKVRHERRVELAFEEHRFWDVRRWQIAGNPEVLNIYRMEMDTSGNFLGKSIWETRTWLDSHYLMPIPQSEMDKNKNLTQNSGY
ncbi:MAG: hypothetical protein ACI8ZX_001788 [Planctomycetota bacterium]|jgi:hypothetical protein